MIMSSLRLLFWGESFLLFGQIAWVLIGAGVIFALQTSYGSRLLWAAVLAWLIVPLDYLVLLTICRLFGDGLCNRFSDLFGIYAPMLPAMAVVYFCIVLLVSYVFRNYRLQFVPIEKRK